MKTQRKQKTEEKKDCNIDLQINFVFSITSISSFTLLLFKLTVLSLPLHNHYIIDKNWFSSTELAQSVVDAGAVPLLVLCIQEPELSLKRISASALSDICKHSPELAQNVVDAGAIAHLATMILNPDAKLKVIW